MSNRVLIVEDDIDLREALSQILRDEGYEVSSAEHGGEALRTLKSGDRPCVILLDLTMPVMNGWQFRARQKKDPEISAIPVVILSAGHDLAGQMPALQVKDYIRKPIQLGHLLDTIKRYCG